MKKKILGILIILTFFIASSVEAKEINSFYSETSDNIKVEETINGDSAILGNKVNISGVINGIGFIAGQDLTINGNLEYGFLAGQNIKINNTIEKNAYIIGQDIKFTKKAKIGRDIFLAGTSVTIDNTLKRDANIYADKVTIKKGSIVNGNINLNAKNIKIEDNVVIKGKLSYNANAKTDISKTAKIKDIKTYTIKTTNEINKTKVLTSLLNMIVVFLVIAIIIPKAVDRTNNIYENKGKYIKNVGTGLLVLICVPLVSLILLASNVGIALGFILVALYVAGLYLSLIVAGYIIGNIIITDLLKLNINKYLSGIIGIIILKLLLLIPIASILIGLYAITLGLGTIWDLLKENNANTKSVTKLKNE